MKVEVVLVVRIEADCLPCIVDDTTQASTSLPGWGINVTQDVINVVCLSTHMNMPDMYSQQDILLAIQCQVISVKSSKQSFHTWPDDK